MSKRTDVFTRTQRSRVMSLIRGKNTIPEVQFRKALYALGIRYRLHSRHLPGRPDIVIPKEKVAIFVNGCFWHGHQCALFRWPIGNAAFWRTKIDRNIERDKRNRRMLRSAGWTVMVIWECSIRRASDEVIAKVAKSTVGKIRRLNA